MKQNLLRISISLAMITIASLTWAHDIIVTTDSKKIDAKILEVSKSEIKYKDIDNLDGPTFILPVGDIHCVIYSNGKVDIFFVSLHPYSAHAEGLCPQWGWDMDI